MFQKALLEATYIKGTPGKLTPEHEKAEHHRFKSNYLFKDKKKPIPRDLYALRLIQQLLIIQKLEMQLQNLPDSEKNQIGAFFTLSFLDHLWRTKPMKEDLKQLGINPSAIPVNKVSITTGEYLKDIEKLKPKALLAHFLLHVVGFMFGGSVIKGKYINPSNKLTPDHPITTNQYDFTHAISCLSSEKKISKSVYESMMQTVNTITLDEQEYEEIFAQCKGIYETMSDMYDDLCDMHHAQLIENERYLALMILSVCASGMLMLLMNDVFNPVIGYGP